MQYIIEKALKTANITQVVQQINRSDILSAIEIINMEIKQNKQVDYPIIEDLEGQMILIKIVQNAGHDSIITEIISNDVEKEEFIKNIGLKAIERTLRDGTLSVKDVKNALAISSISSEKAQETWDSLENEWKNIKASKVMCVPMFERFVLKFCLLNLGYQKSNKQNSI